MSKPRYLWVPAVVSAASLGMAGAYVASQHRDSLREFFTAQTLERPARRLSYAEHQAALSRGGVLVVSRLARAGESVNTRKLARHIVGIERWGQARLRRFLTPDFLAPDFLAATVSAAGAGAAPGRATDSHRPYKPPRDAGWTELLSDLSTTRAGTVELARQLQASPPPEHLRVPHNSLGELSARGWLRYLSLHADLESRRARSVRPAQ